MQRLSFRTLPSFRDNDFLFTNSVGHPVNPNNYAKAFRTILRDHNVAMNQLESDLGYLPPNKHVLPEIRLYDARHSFATNNIMSNSASIKVISEILGHSNIKTTLSNYTQVTQSMSKSAIDEYSKKILSKVSL